jgi:hypothetical protein
MMEFGLCNLAVAPVRREPSDKSEMSTQLLFGDLVEVNSQEGSWLRIKILFDGYEGWVDAKQIREVSNHEFRRLGKAHVWVNRQLYSDAVEYSGVNIRLPAACSFYHLKGQVMEIDGEQYSLSGKAYPFTFKGLSGLLETAAGYLSCPYLWGGKTYLGLDCSGFTQVVYKQHGIKLLRDAAQQATQGELISTIYDGKPGDLAFFDNEDEKIVHVGILLEEQRIIHCSGKVRIDSIDHQGIYNRYLSKYTHDLRLIRRVIPSK